MILDDIKIKPLKNINRIDLASNYKIKRKKSLLKARKVFEKKYQRF